MYLLVALLCFHRTLSANDQIQLSSLNNDETLEAVDQEPLEQTQQVYWKLQVWSTWLYCKGQASGSWTDWVYHDDCESYNYRRLSYNPGQNGIYRLCVYQNNQCGGLLYQTSYGQACIILETLAKSWKIIKAVEDC